MSDSFDVDKSSINKLCQLIISKIDNSETKDMFLNRLSELGYDFCDDIGNKNYQVHEMTAYLVNSDFPILREVDIKSEAINNVGYELVLKLINDYKEKIR